jgi:rubrerythrin
MCTCGESYDVDADENLPTKDYICNECENKFKGLGKNVKCPSCKSKNVTEK